MDRDTVARMAVEYCRSLVKQNVIFEEAAERAINFVSANLPISDDFDMAWLLCHLKLSVSQEVSDYLLLQGLDQRNKVKWWSNEKNNNHRLHWNRWQTYLVKNKKWSMAVIESIDETTDKLLDTMDNPKDKSVHADRRGLVLGYVQSGKTSHYTGLINKSLDAGFEVIIVLAGMHDSLRMQTQSRLDEEVFGIDSSYENAISNGGVRTTLGVGEISLTENLLVNMYTGRDKKGDFKKNQANKIQPLGGRPSVFIVKKNASVLNNLYQFFRTGNLTKDHLLKDGKGVIANFSMLMIDDEADQASVNTNTICDEYGNLLPDYEPSRVNAAIRKIYNLFANKAYVGYTATPFANIFIHNEANSEDYGYELFPKDFIISLPKPSNYIGPAEFFGLDRSDGESMDLIREVKYDPKFVPAKAKKGFVPESLPESLVDAIGAFIISCAIRCCRGHCKEHMSMLIHAARYTDIHKEIKDLVVQKVDSIKNRIRYENPQDNHSFSARLKKIYSEDFINTSDQMRESFQDLAGPCITPDWNEVFMQIDIILQKLEVLEVNGVSLDELNYIDHPDGRIVIAIGGDKLSRGLTLEGLSISYFLRSSTLYDTLMQMGRWFGYRPDYLDLCRLYTTKTLADWFEHIAVATEELRGELFDMEQKNATPEEYGLKIQTHPVMSVSARNKMKTSFQVLTDYSNTVSETTKFELDDESFFRRNMLATNNFIYQLGNPDPTYLYRKRPLKYKINSSIPKHYFWEHVTGNAVCGFLGGYLTANNAPRANSAHLQDYILKQMANNALTDWTVCLINSMDTNDAITHYIAELPIGKGVRRALGKGRSSKRGAKAFGRLLSQEHEYLDFDDSQMELVKHYAAQAQAKHGHRSKIITDDEGVSWEMAPYIRRKLRTDPTHGLLLIYPIEKTELFNHLAFDIIPIGIGLVFPPSHDRTTITYVANNIYYQAELEDEHDE